MMGLEAQLSELCPLQDFIKDLSLKLSDFYNSEHGLFYSWEQLYLCHTPGSKTYTQSIRTLWKKTNWLVSQCMWDLFHLR